MITGLTPQTFENLQLNSGVFMEGDNQAANMSLLAMIAHIRERIEKRVGVLGATIGDGSFQCTPEIRQMEANGMRYPVVGSTVNDLWTIKMTGTMKEITADNFKRVLASSDISENLEKGIKTVRVRTDIRKEDYIPKLWWFGDTSLGLVRIELSNALNITGANFTFTDRGEGSLPFEFQAHHANLSDMDYAPFQIDFFFPIATADSATDKDQTQTD